MDDRLLLKSCMSILLQSSKMFHGFDTNVWIDRSILFSILNQSSQKLTVVYTVPTWGRTGGEYRGFFFGAESELACSFCVSNVAAQRIFYVSTTEDLHKDQIANLKCKFTAHLTQCQEMHLFWRTFAIIKILAKQFWPKVSSRVNGVDLR